MDGSLVGSLVFVAVLLIGYLSRGYPIVSLIASLAFGSTAVFSVSWLGGSTPLLHSYFSIILIIYVLTRKSIIKDLDFLFQRVLSLWIIMFSMIYAVAGAVLLPRLFSGQTTAFVQGNTRGPIIENALAPVSGNITQTGYFVLGGLTAIAISTLLLRHDALKHVLRGFFLFCYLTAGFGLLDLAGKIVWAADLLGPIRTADYAMLTRSVDAGFWRIAGSFSEASAFAAASLVSIAFTYTYWRKTGANHAKWLTLTLLLLLLLSTSTTAYVGLAVLSVPVIISFVKGLHSKRLEPYQITILAVLPLAISLAAAMMLLDARFFEPFYNLIDKMVLSKAWTSSGQERFYWNLKSIGAFIDTGGIGIGLGSSRASSWPIAVISQLGLIGAVSMAALVLIVIRGLGRLSHRIDPETESIVACVRASALASILGVSISGGSADPGIVFFIGVAVISVSRAHAAGFVRSWSPIAEMNHPDLARSHSG